MLVSPIMSYNLKGQIKPELLELAENVCIESAKISSGYNQYVVNAFRDVLRITNSYYSSSISNTRMLKKGLFRYFYVNLPYF